MQKKMTARERRKRRQSNRRRMILALVVVWTLGGLISFRVMEMEKQNEQYAAKQEELQQKIDDENERTQELNDYKEYTKTREFAEKVAKEKFGLLYDDELKFKSE